MDHGTCGPRNLSGLQRKDMKQEGGIDDKVLCENLEFLLEFRTSL